MDWEGNHARGGTVFYRLRALGLALRDVGRVFDGPTSTLRVPGTPDTFHALGMLFGRRCYVMWRRPHGAASQFLEFALRDTTNHLWDATEGADYEWTGGMLLAAEHRIGPTLVTLQELRAAELAAFFSPEPWPDGSPRAMRPRVPGNKRGKGKKPAMVQVTLRMPPATLHRWRDSGPGWQTRMRARLSAPHAAAQAPASKRTRSRKGEGGELVSLRLPALVRSRWQATGRGWQSRAVALLSQLD